MRQGTQDWYTEMTLRGGMGKEVAEIGLESGPTPLPHAVCSFFVSEVCFNRFHLPL